MLGPINDQTEAFSHVPEHGFSLFLANRTKTIHFVRHAEGEHNEANRAAGDETPVTVTTPGSWRYLDARLTPLGIEQCVQAREKLLHNVHPQLIVVSPFTRTIQTAHVMFGGSNSRCSQSAPFLVHDLCRERSGRFTCDKRRPKSEIVQEMKPVYDLTGDAIDFESFGYPTEQDLHWTEKREDSELVVQRCIDFMQWLASRPEREIAVVTHSSFLKHLFRSFGHQTAEKDKSELHRLAGNAEVRSICLALHRGFYPPGQWVDNNVFMPDDPTFRRGRWAPTIDTIASLHKKVAEERKSALSSTHEKTS